MLVKDDLAQKLLDDGYGGLKDAQDKPMKPTKAMLGLADGVIKMLRAATVQGPATGTGIPSGGPVTGSMTMNKIIGLQHMILFQAIRDSNEGAKPHPQTLAPMMKQAQAIAEHFMTFGSVVFNNLSGSCTAVYIPPPGSSTPGVLVGGVATNGKLQGLQGAILAEKVKQALGMQTITPYMIKFYKALCDYVQQNIELNYTVGSVTGTFPPPAAPPPAPVPLAGGFGTGGQIR